MGERVSAGWRGLHWNMCLSWIIAPFLWTRTLRKLELLTLICRYIILSELCSISQMPAWLVQVLHLKTVFKFQFRWKFCLLLSKRSKCIPSSLSVRCRWTWLDPHLKTLMVRQVSASKTILNVKVQIAGLRNDPRCSLLPHQVQCLLANLRNSRDLWQFLKLFLVDQNLTLSVLWTWEIMTSSVVGNVLLEWRKQACSPDV